MQVIENKTSDSDANIDDSSSVSMIRGVNVISTPNKYNNPTPTTKRKKGRKIQNKPKKNKVNRKETEAILYTKEVSKNTDHSKRNSVIVCDHTKFEIGSYKEIDSPAYCKVGQELCGTKCGAPGCDKEFVHKKGTKNGINRENDNGCVEYMPSAKNIVMACMHVNNCDFALCITCYNEMLLQEEGGERGRSRRGRGRKS